LSPVQVALAISEQAWPAAVLLIVLCLLKVPVVNTSAWILLLKLVGVSKAERRRVSIAAAKHHLNVRDPP
jgi:hypothetical protein